MFGLRWAKLTHHLVSVSLMQPGGVWQEIALAQSCKVLHPDLQHWQAGTVKKSETVCKESSWGGELLPVAPSVIYCQAHVSSSDLWGLRRGHLSGGVGEPHVRAWHKSEALWLIGWLTGPHALSSDIKIILTAVSDGEWHWQWDFLPAV